MGRALVNAAESTARRFGVPELWLRTETAGPFHERCGWSYAVPKQGLRLAAVLRRACSAERQFWRGPVLLVGRGLRKL